MKGLALLPIIAFACPLQAAIVYRADLRPENVVPLKDGVSPAGLSNAWGVGIFELNLTPGAPTMTYEITFHNLSLDDITGVHFHFGHDPANPPSGHASGS